MTTPEFLDQPPEVPDLTDYDREHVKLYARLLDAVSAGADWRDAVKVLFDIDPEEAAERARTVHDAQLKRAKWKS